MNMRYELKFYMSPAQKMNIMRWLVGRRFLQRAYPNRNVHSLYFDSMDLETVKASLQGISRRKKYRLRWYTGESGKAYGTRYEIKMKQSSLGTKFTEDTLIDPFELLKESNSTIARTVSQDPSCQRLGVFATLSPALQVNYLREYYSMPSGIRLTIDTDITFTNVLLDKQTTDNNNKSYDFGIVEIKFGLAEKDIVSSLLTDFPLRIVRSSKYLLGLSLFDYVNYI